MTYLTGESSPCGDINDPISTEEVLAAITKPRQGGAPSPDEISLCQVKKDETSVALLTGMFNMWLACGTLPERVQGSRTILISRLGRCMATYLDRGNIGEDLWPCNGTKDRRMCSNITKATGFVAGCGPGTNLFILSEVCRLARSGKRNLEVIFLDLSSAFNSIPHKTLIGSLRNRGLTSTS